MELHLSGNGKEGGGVPDDGGIHLETQEHGHKVHFYAITVRPVWGSGKGTGGAGGDAVVVVGGY